MNDVAVTVSANRSPAIGDQREPRDIRRALQLVLATVWLVDGLLQFQPFMFTRAFGSQMLAATAQGNPSAVAHSITWADLVIGHHSVVADAVFAVVQILIGFGIAWRPTIKPALALSIVWSCGVWWFGEGLGGLFSGTANPMNGAPGAVLLYAVLAVLLWPADRTTATTRFIAARAVGASVARGVWIVLWGLLGFVALLGANRSPQGLHQIVSQMATGQPHWLAGLDHHVANLLAHRGLGFSVGLAVILGIIAVGVFLPSRLARVTVVLALVLGAGIWVLGENFGGHLHRFGHGSELGTIADADRRRLLALSHWPTPQCWPQARSRGGVAVQGPGWVPESFAGLMIAVSIYCSVRLLASRALRRRINVDVNVAHVTMGVAMAGMLVPALTTLPTGLWEAVFVGLAVWFFWHSVRFIARHLGQGGGHDLHHVSHYLTHLVMSCAMLYMYLAAPTVPRRTRAGCRWVGRREPRRTSWGFRCSF